MSDLLSTIGYRLAKYLSESSDVEESVATCTPEELEQSLQPGDVLLIDGNSRFSTAIKYITQSTWSHATICIENNREDDDTEPVLIEADVTEGVRTIPLGRYCNMHTRICRPASLSEEETQNIIKFMKEKIGHQYDLKNIVDLARYLIQTPPVPKKHRRKLLALGSGDPTKAICSSLIAEAYQSVNYPILPRIETDEESSEARRREKEKILHIRHHSLFAPRDFDVSPYFKIIKPTLESGFDHSELNWAEDGREKNGT